MLSGKGVKSYKYCTGQSPGIGVLLLNVIYVGFLT